MAELERFDTWRQRAAMTSLASESAFLESAEGAALMEQFSVLFAPSIVATARRMGYHMEPDDVVSMMLVQLLSNDGRAAEYAATAEDPWAYLGACAMDWARQEWGHRGASLDSADWIPDRSSQEDESDLTPIAEVVALMFEQLGPRTDPDLHGDLLELLGWLAANPAQRRSYEREERVAAHRHCPRLTVEQVTAVMNISWGGRPRLLETSLMRAFLLDANFRPSDSPTHARALTYYKNAMRAGAQGSRMLTDWT